MPRIQQHSRKVDSYYITLPKLIVKTENWQLGDSLHLIKQEDGTIKLEHSTIGRRFKEAYENFMTTTIQKKAEQKEGVKQKPQLQKPAPNKFAIAFESALRQEQAIQAREQREREEAEAQTAYRLNV